MGEPLSLDSFTKISRPTRTKWAVLGRRSRQVDARVERQRLADIAIEREAHYRRRRSEAYALRAFGKVVPSPCGAECPVCHPQASTPDPAYYEIRDLRQGRAAVKRPTGKTGTCRLCGKPCAKRYYYHRACRLSPAAIVKRTPTCLWDAKPLTGGQVKWCSRSCCAKAYRARTRPAAQSKRLP